jgi:hypothetical protein
LSYSNHLVEQLDKKNNRYIASLNIAFKPSIVVVDKNQRKVPIPKIFRKGQTICLYFTETMCPPCVETHITKFKEFEKIYGADRLRILITTRNTEALSNINYRYLTDIPFYHIVSEALPFEDVENTPVVFIVNDLLYISGVFFTETQISQNNAKYYSKVEQLLQ